MKAATAPAAIDPEHHRQLFAENAQLREQLQSLQRQLDWFKRQLFGQKSAKRHLLQSKVLAMDETPIKAGRAGKGKLKTGWYWPIYGEADEVCFTYSASRGSQHVKDQLAGFKGVLLSDGYAAYEQFARHRPEVTHAQCWAHTRRHFEQAQASDPQVVTLQTPIPVFNRSVPPGSYEFRLILDNQVNGAVDEVWTENVLVTVE